MLPGIGGGLRFVDDEGGKVFEAPAGHMWDSTGDSATAGMATPSVVRGAERTVTASEDSASNPANPEAPSEGSSSGDKTAALPVQITEDGLAIVPDLKLLRGADTVYPVYVDPPVSALTRSDWTAVSSDGDKFWEFKGDKGTGYCKDYAGYLCSSTPYRARNTILLMLAGGALPV